MQVITDRLTVPGASLYYEVRGSGPALLIIPSGNGDAAPFLPLAETLSDEYTVITYDRRGFSRSPLNRPVGDDRISDDAHDIGALLELLADGPAAVFGSSSGAIVALATLERHPDQVRTVIAHEPPLASVLPDAEHWLGFYADLYETYRTDGVDAARKAFRVGMGMDTTTKAPRKTELPPDELEEMLGRIRRNYVFWFEHELLPYPAYRPDLNLLKSLAGKLVLAGGDTARDGFPYRPNTVLAEHTGNEIVHLPGGHVGYVTHPDEFAVAIRELIRP
jgi:pimeloyl-ACP methyl ester carboxylesterase